MGTVLNYPAGNPNSEVFFWVLCFGISKMFMCVWRNAAGEGGQAGTGLGTGAWWGGESREEPLWFSMRLTVGVCVWLDFVVGGRGVFTPTT